MLNSTELKCTQNIKLYHYVRIPFCPYTILSVAICPQHFVRCYFVRSPSEQVRQPAAVAKQMSIGVCCYLTPVFLSASPSLFDDHGLHVYDHTNRNIKNKVTLLSASIVMHAVCIKVFIYYYIHMQTSILGGWGCQEIQIVGWHQSGL